MEMGSDSHSHPTLVVVEEEEEYINMEITPYTPPSPLSKDFEFQHLSTSTPAASDLFYRGKLLPLPLPLRRPFPFLTSSTAPCTTSHTPSDSCNISPSESCRPSCDLSSTAAALFEWPTDVTAFFINNISSSSNQPRRNSSWWKMKLNKRSYLAHKLKSSRAYLKSLFFDNNNNNPSPPSRIAKRFPTTTLIKKSAAAAADDHRRSFFGAIATDISSSSSSSSGSFGSRGRRSSAEEIEVSIDAAIAHCKKSMLSFGV